jgi:hypothetical protein
VAAQIHRRGDDDIARSGERSADERGVAQASLSAESHVELGHSDVPHAFEHNLIRVRV